MIFFIVHTDDEGKILDINTDQISSIDEANAEDYALRVMKAGKDSGKIEGYKFAVKQLGQGRLIFFMDTSAPLETYVAVK